MRKDKTCWTCPYFIYSGELNVGSCSCMDTLANADSWCENHPNFDESEEQNNCCPFCSCSVE